MKSIRTTLTVWLMVPLSIVAVLFSLETYYSVKKTSDDLNDRTLLAASLTILEHVISSNGSLLADTALDTLKETLGDQFFYYVRGPNGAFITGYSQYPKPNAKPDWPENKPLFYNGTHRGNDVRVVQLNRDLTDRELNGVTTIFVWQQTTHTQTLVYSLFARSLARLLLLTLVAGIIVWFAVKSGLRPLERLQTSIDNRSSYALNPIKQMVPIELQGIVESMNKLLGRVARSKKNRERFVGDAAHQLRNPIAAIKVQAQAALESNDQEAMQSGLNQILEVSDNSASMINKMLSGIGAHALDNDHFTEFYLNNIIKTKASELAPVAFDKDQDIATSGLDEPLHCQGNEVLLGEAFSNLIHNAITHNAHGTYIGISLCIDTENKCINFSIEDEGKVFTEEEFNAFLQPFRTGGNNPGSSGLGLSIAKDISRLHKGDLLTRKTDIGKAIVMQLPLDMRISPQI